jgi:hypothetical protein
MINYAVNRNQPSFKVSKKNGPLDFRQLLPINQQTLGGLVGRMSTSGHKETPQSLCGVGKFRAPVSAFEIQLGDRTWPLE